MSRENENVHKINPLMPKNNPLCSLPLFLLVSNFESHDSVRKNEMNFCAVLWRIIVMVFWSREISTTSHHHEDRSNFVKFN